MITATLLVDLLRRFVLLDDEPIVWSKDWPDGPMVDLQTTDRYFTVQVEPDWLLVRQAPWAEAVVVATRKDVMVDGGGPRRTFLVQGDGAVIDLDDTRAVAELGMRLHRGELDVAAYAQVLVNCQWPGGWRKRHVLDPVAWRREYPDEARLPQAEAMLTSRADGTLHIRFYASRENALVVGGRPVLDVTAWTVRVRADEPATWEVRPVAEAVPLRPPW
jgi:hypothetical protein